MMRFPSIAFSTSEDYSSFHCFHLKSIITPSFFVSVSFYLNHDLPSLVGEHLLRMLCSYVMLSLICLESFLIPLLSRRSALSRFFKLY